jgi:YYY domain-containing protein
MQTVLQRSSKHWSSAIGRWTLIGTILLVGAFFRFTNLNWDEGLWIHPDEAHMQSIASTIRMPDCLSLYFDTHNSPLNCRNYDRQYSYGTLPLFLTRLTAEWLDRGCGESPSMPNAALASLLLGLSDDDCSPGTFTNLGVKLVGRMLSGLADLGTLVLVYLIGRRLHGEIAGLLAAGLAMLTAFSIQQAHFFTVDSMACFFTVLTATFAVEAGRSGNWADFGLAGLATGLAAACKVSAAPAAFLVALAAVAWIWSLPRSRRSSAVWRMLLCLVLAGLLALVAFRVAQPYAFEGPGFFGVRPSPEWFGRLSQISVEQSGEADYPSGRQWANRTPILFPLKDMVFWGMGLPLGLAAWAGWTVMGVELWRGKRDHLILWGWATVIFLYHGTRWVKTMRTFLPLYPLFAIFAAYLLIRLCRVASRRWRRVGYALTALVVVGTALWAMAVLSIYLRSHTRLASSRWIIANIPEGSTLAGEHWDWTPPLRVDGVDPFGGMYAGFEMHHYDEDTPEKRLQLYDWLDQADYIIVGSNRLYASVARLPGRYPLTIAYYRALFAGELGFDLMADFASRPALFGLFQFPDQEEPFPLADAGYVYQTEPIEVYLPPADEAFSVYDHPRVLIFRKTADFSRERVVELLGGIGLERVLYGQTPREASVAPDLLQFDAATWADQQAGGTWSEMFNRNSFLNRYPGLAAVAWWAVVALLGWLAFPLLFVSLPHLRDRGYGLARVLGLLLVAYLTWLAASLHLLPNTRETILRMVLLLALVGGGVGWFRREALRRFLGTHWRLLLLTEGLLALLYIVWIGVRLLQPDLWHPTVGGEKPMDFAYFNAVMKSTWFPPYNPWLSGSYINYYYFGFVFVGTLTKLVGTVPAIAYNLAVPLLFALTGVGAFSVAYNLFGGHRRGALLAGAMALVFTVVLGNLGVVRVLRTGLVRLSGEVLFPSTIPGFPETVAMVRGLWQVLAHGADLPLRVESWYWDPTRIIPAGPGEPGPITEFPAFTFLYADLHAHMIAMPLAFLALAATVYWMRTSRPRWASYLIGGLAIGALYPTNTWDYPTYLILALAGLAVGIWAWREQPPWRRVKTLVLRAVMLIGLTLLPYLPYIQHYAVGYSTARRWDGVRTPIDVYFWIHGIMLFPLLTRLLIEVGRVLRWKRTPNSRFVSCKAGMAAALWFVLLAVALVLAVFLEFTLALVTVLDMHLPVTHITLWGTHASVPVAYVTLPVAVLAALLILAPRMPSSRRLVWLMVGLAMALCLVVEIVVLEGDIGRMNTVFKFYLQVWLLLAVAASVSLAWVWQRARRWRQEGRLLWWIGMAVLVLCGALFLPLGVRARAADRISKRTGSTLDGMAFAEHSVVFDGDPDRGFVEIPLVGDYHAIRWMQDEITGSPVIMEGLGYREYLWAGRISIYTGLPAVVGWRWHQVQQRLGVLPTELVEWRRNDVDECYNTASILRAREILARYGVRYIYVSEYERAYYDSVGLAKFDVMVTDGSLQVVYDARGVRIYEVLE